MEVVCDKKIMSSLIIDLYVNKSFLLYNRCLETYHINIQTIPHFVNIWSKEVPLNISYPIIVNKICGYLDARICHTSVRYIISREKQF